MKMRHLVLFVIAFCAIFHDGCAQNRGNARYVPPEDYEGEVTRTQRTHPTRLVPIRRQRPSKAPESSVVDEEASVYQPPEQHARLDPNARRGTPRNSPQQLAPPPPPPPPLSPAEAAAVTYPKSSEEVVDVTTSLPEKRPQGRRRRQKKRRKPQTEVNAPIEQEKPSSNVHENNKAVIEDLLDDDRKRSPQFHDNSQSRNAASNFDPQPPFQPDHALWSDKFAGNTADSPADDAGSQYFRPQPATNRLPVSDSEVIEAARGYPESAPPHRKQETPNVKYIDSEPQISIPDRASYVPVLSPIRRPTEELSRLPHEEHVRDNDKETIRHTISLDRHNRHRTQTTRAQSAPLPDPDEILRQTDIKPAQNLIPQTDKSANPSRGHSEIRLPQDEQPLLVRDYISSGYNPSGYDPSEDILDNLRQNEKSVDEESETPPTPTNRLPNPSEVHYESVYPPYLSDEQDIPRERSSVNAPLRRQETDSARNIIGVHNNNPRRDSSTRPHEHDNDAVNDRREPSQYQPPLQRTGSRYRPDNSDIPPRSRTRAPQQAPSEPPNRGRGVSRHQASDVTDTPTRTRGSSRYQPDAPEESSRTRNDRGSVPTRVRAPVEQPTTRSRGPQRYQPEQVEDGSRLDSRRQQPHAEVPESTEYLPAAPAYRVNEEIDQEDPRTLRHPSRSPQRTPVSSEERQEDIASLRNTLRSRPQYESPREEFAYEEPVRGQRDSGAQYQPPRQHSPREDSERRIPAPRSQPEYQPPQNPRSTRGRQQSNYQVPQNPADDQIQPVHDQRPTNSRSHARPRHPEQRPPQQTHQRTSKFSCPDAYGFFADPVQCDKYYECRNGTSEEHFCNDGLAFNEVSAPKFLRCDSLRDVDCRSRPKLQEAQPSKNCPRKFGLFPHETDCTKFWNCVDGSATEIQCPPGLSYNDERATCDWADLVKSSCKTEDLLGFSCPEPTAYDLQDGVYTRYPHPSNCQLHFTCIKGEDGLRRPRLLSCNEGLVFNADTGACARPEEVPGCENFYGNRSPAPNRKPARQPSPTESEEEYEEPPTPRPRRRGSTRRTRN